MTQKKNSMFPKLLLLSNDCISQSSSNGRTMRNFLLGWDKEKLAQFCIHLNLPDYDVCNNYFVVTDRDALNAFLHKKSPINNNSGNVGIIEKNKQRNALTTYLRDIVWNSGKWKTNDYYNWVDNFKPDVLLLQAGDSAFMYRLADEISKSKNIPLVIYNSESYYLKNFDYFKSKGFIHFFYRFYHRKFCKQFKTTIKNAKHSIYISERLKENYYAEFGLPSDVIYTSTETVATEYVENKKLVISYLGNLGVGRHESLIKIAEMIEMISPDLKIDIYGKIVNQEIKSEFASCKNINYCGFVSYAEVQNIIRNSDIILHVENFSHFYIKDSEFAFSTKIADSLACGRCFLLYAPKELEICQYLKDNDAAYVATDDNELETILKKIIFNKESRMSKVNNALKLAEKNHNLIKNSDRFKEILFSAVNR